MVRANVRCHGGRSCGGRSRRWRQPRKVEQKGPKADQAAGRLLLQSSSLRGEVTCLLAFTFTLACEHEVVCVRTDMRWCMSAQTSGDVWAQTGLVNLVTEPVVRVRTNIR